MGHSAGPSFISLLLVILLAFTAPLLAHSLKRWRLPIVVVEIAVGVIFGRSGFDLIVPESHLQFLSTFGFAYLMFLSGLEMDVQALIPPRNLGISFWRSPLALSLGRLAVIFAVALSSCLVLQRTGLIENALFIAFLLSNTSLGIVIAILKEHRLTATSGGQLTLTATLTADLLSVFGLSSYVALHGSGGEFRIFLVLILFLAAVVIYRIVEFWRGRAMWFDAAFEAMSHGTAQLPLRAAFALALLFIVLAEVLGTEMMLGAFLAGVVVSVLLGAGGKVLREKLDVIGYGFLVPIFFIMVGAQLDLSVLVGSSAAIPLIVILLLLALGINLLGSLFFIPFIGWRNGISFGMLMTTRLALTVAGASIGLQAGMISPVTKVALVVISIITCVIGPMIFTRLYGHEEEKKSRRRWLVVGNDLETVEVAESLRRSGVVVRVLTSSPRLLRLEREGEVEMLMCDRCLPETIFERCGDDLDGIILALKSGSRTLEVARILKYRYGVEKILALVRSERTALLLRDLGVQGLSRREAIRMVVQKYIDSPALFSAMTEIDKKRIFEVVLRSASGLSYGELAGRLPIGVSLLLVSREGEEFSAGPDTMMMNGDVLTLMAEPVVVDQAGMLESLCSDDVCSFEFMG